MPPVKLCEEDDLINRVLQILTHYGVQYQECQHCQHNSVNSMNIDNIDKIVNFDNIVNIVNFVNMVINMVNSVIIVNIFNIVNTVLRSLEDTWILLRSRNIFDISEYFGILGHCQNC